MTSPSEKVERDVMRDYPHRYAAGATAGEEGEIILSSARLPTLVSAAPAEFGGPGDRWSPETLLVAAVADCFILTFRAIARLSKLPWSSVTCDVVGTLDRIERVPQFTGFEVRARLVVPAGTNVEQARRLMAKAEQGCLITNSLKARSHLEATVDVA
jgi:organic hydroperoxide reductase OsmC/OhrA